MEKTDVATNLDVDEIPVPDAPTDRARMLREELFGSALTLDEAAYVLSLDRTTVAKYLRERVLLGFQIGREWLIPEEELRAYIRGVVQMDRTVPEAAQGSTEVSPPGRPRKVMVRLRKEMAPGGKRRLDPGFDRFTERARTVLTLAEEEARALHHRYIGSEHLLLGLLAEGQGVAGHALTALGVGLEEARGVVATVTKRGDKAVIGNLDLTPRTKKVIELAVGEARRLEHRYVGTEHLLLGLLREGEGIAAGVLETLGLQLEQLRSEVLQLLERSLAPVPPEAMALPGVQEGHLCPVCGARSPRYFNHCFNCGERLAV